MAELIVEVLSRGGAPSVFHAVNAWPLRVGRALDNDLVLPDPFISPYHCTIEQGSDGFVVTDQGSTNGTFAGAASPIRNPCELSSGGQITIGHTNLRLWSPSHPVPPALPFRPPESRFRRIGIPVASFFILLATICFVVFDRWLGTSKVIKLVSLIAESIPLLFFPILWASAWTLAGFIARRRGRYSLQLIVSNAAFLLFFGLTSLAEYVDYNTNSVRISDITHYAGMTALSVLLLVANLKIATGVLDMRRVIIALAVALGVIGAVAVNDHAESSENRISPTYSRTLKPPFAKIAGSESLDEFIKTSEKLFKEKKK